MSPGPVKPGLVVKHPEDASTDVGSSDEVTNSPDIVSKPRKGNKLVAKEDVHPAGGKASRHSRRKKEQKEVSSLRSELRAKGNEVMSEVAQCSKASAKPKAVSAARKTISSPPGLTCLPEKPSTEAHSDSWREVEKALMLLSQPGQLAHFGVPGGVVPPMASRTPTSSFGLEMSSNGTWLRMSL
eukprot:symbB.v1.2.033931.t1/scaffold4288.1/size41896/2